MIACSMHRVCGLNEELKQTLRGVSEEQTIYYYVCSCSNSANNSSFSSRSPRSDVYGHRPSSMLYRPSRWTINRLVVGGPQLSIPVNIPQTTISVVVVQIHVNVHLARRHHHYSKGHVLYTSYSFYIYLPLLHNYI